MPLSPSDLTQRLSRLEDPRASAYPSEWIPESHMGPNVLWLAESLTQLRPRRPGLRILDLGCGRALSSLFEHGLLPETTEAGMLRADGGRTLGFVRLVARKLPLPR
jgi:hypothetical protein